MKKLLLFLFMFLSSFLIHENCSALEVSEVNDSNIMEYIEQNYSDYIKDYSFLIKMTNSYYFVSSDVAFYFTIASATKVDFKLLNPTSKINYNVLSLKLSDLSVESNYKNLSIPAGNKFGMNIGYADRSALYYSNFDLYAVDSSLNILDTLLYAKNYPVEAEPSPSPNPEPTPTPDTPALPGDEGGVSADEVISVYMKYFLMCLPVALIMVSIEKLIEIFHNFVFGKMRKC